MVAYGLELKLNCIRPAVHPAMSHELGIYRNRLLEEWRGPLAKGLAPIGLWSGQRNHLRAAVREK
jgi:hypothetical protein